MIRVSALRFLLLILFVASAHVVFAQGGGTPGKGSGGNQGEGQPLINASSNLPIYNVYRSGEIRIDVNLWGYVVNPGHFTVPGSTNLVEMLSYAGGPSSAARLVDIRIVHADTALEKRVQIYNLEAYKDNGDLSQNPLLQPGDTIIVSGRALDVFFQAVSIITNVMVIITALINFISFTTK